MRMMVDFKAVVRTSRHIYKVLIEVNGNPIYLNPYWRTKTGVYSFLSSIGIQPESIGYVSLVEKTAEPQFVINRRKK